MSPDIPKAGLKTLNHRSDWNTARLKFLFSRETRPVLETDEVVTAFRDGTVTLRKNRREDGFTFAEKEIGYQGIEPGDLVVHAMDGFAGAIGVSDSRGKGSPVLSIATPISDAEPRFWAYYLRNLAVTGFIQSLAKGIRERSTDFRWKDASNLLVNFPDLETQRQIADFLDRETARIDLLIEKKQRFIEALAQKWAATVTFTLTNGLNPAAPKKDADVSWIGKVPEHWSVAKLGHIGRCANGINIGGDAFGSGFPFVSYGDAYKNPELPRSVNGLVQSSAEERARYDLKEGDVLFTRTSETIEEIGFSSVCMEDMPNAVFAGFLIRFRPSKGTLHPLFSKFLFRNERLRAFFSKEMMIVTRASLSQGLLQRMPVVLPPIEEQHDIGQHLKKLEDTFLSVADKTQESIERLKEYRSALITAAVTGLIDMGHNNDPGSIEQEIAAADDKDEIIVPFEDPSVQVLEAEMNRADLRDAPRKAGQFYIKLMVQRFNGLKIEIFANEHPPPHFRVKTSDGTANFRIDNCEPLNGDRAILRRQREIVRWHQDNKEALIATWDRTRPSDCPVGKFRKGDAL